MHVLYMCVQNIAYFTENGLNIDYDDGVCVYVYVCTCQMRRNETVSSAVTKRCAILCVCVCCKIPKCKNILHKS